ncbi:hypothetical protein K457DRAFT_22459 [Linnemannia elongata AG-77]|uniref:Uncharacterized protein n=1 Tax=Linnemannia elongata AG-77 TaxID=1314771 RepID=A0A197JNJ2_9FUNG|nr:hypothetical protein K457DRAFT_22459 [Linnemannia elongata AG-77]
MSTMGQPATTCLSRHFSSPSPICRDPTWFSSFESTVLGWFLFSSNLKLHQGSSNFSERDWNDALSTASATKIEDHAKNFRKYCPDNVYISMIVAYPTKWTDKLPAPSEFPKDPSGVQQVVINVSDNNFGVNFGVIFPQEHVEFIDRLKNARKRSADDDDSNDEDFKKQRS